MQEISSLENLKILSAANNQSLGSVGRLSGDIQKVTEKNRDFRVELGKYKSLYYEYLCQFHNREASLQKLLEMKDCELQSTENELLKTCTEAQKLGQEHQQGLEKLKLLRCFNKTPRSSDLSDKSETFFKILHNLNEIGQFWRNTDSEQYEKSSIEIQELVKNIDFFESEISKIKQNTSETEQKKQKLSEHLQDLSAEKPESPDILQKLKNLHAITSKSALDKENLSIKLFDLQENIEKIKSEKESLAHKLEKIYEKLVNERMNSQQMLEEFTQTKEKCEKTLSKLNEERILKKRLTEQLEHEAENKEKILKELEKSSDLDLALKKTLEDSEAPNEIEKQGDTYFHKGNPITLSLHQETFIVVQEKTGPIPLSDYLLTAVTHLKQKKSENSKPELEKSKSPIRSQGLSTPKPQKTPIRDRLAAKRPFK